MLFYIEIKMILTNYISSRYKLFYSTDWEKIQEIQQQYNLPCIDLGFNFALFLKENLAKPTLSMDCQKHLTQLIETEALTIKNGFLKGIILKNIDILSEQNLGLSVETLLLSLSKNTMIILYWNGEVNENQVFSKQKHAYFNFNDNPLYPLDLQS